MESVIITVDIRDEINYLKATRERVNRTLFREVDIHGTGTILSVQWGSWMADGDASRCGVVIIQDKGVLHCHQFEVKPDYRTVRFLNRDRLVL